MQEDWELLLTFLPDDWRDLASKTGALKGLRKDKSPDGLLRVLLMHLACGHSLRETVVRARQAGLADLSDVALMKRLRKSRDWLRALCIALFEERGVDLSIANGFEIRAFDATVVKEPGKTGSLWYVHYSVRLPSLICDYFRITAASGAGTGESFAQFPVRHGDFVLGDRGYSTARGIAHVASAGGRVTVRVNTGSLVFSGLDGKPFDCCRQCRRLTERALRERGGLRPPATARPSKGGSVRCGSPIRRLGSPREVAPQGEQVGKEAQTQNAGICQIRHSVHDIPGIRFPAGSGSGMVSRPMAGRTGVQALQVDHEARTPAKT